MGEKARWKRENKEKRENRIGEKRKNKEQGGKCERMEIRRWEKKRMEETKRTLNNGGEKKREREYKEKRNKKENWKEWKSENVRRNKGKRLK